MNNLFLLEGFSNYFNKQVKRFDVLDDYLLKCEKYETMGSINFVFADGINTSQILQTKIKIQPDYLIVTDENENIISRWFVIQNDNLRNGQSRLTLKRDVVAEKLEEVLDAEMLIERANVNSDNPLFFVSENENFNQIKQSEHLLKDETGTNWIIGYIARDTNITDKIISITESGKQNYTPIEALNLTLKDDKNPAAGATFTVANKLTIDTTFQDDSLNYYYDCRGEISGADLKDVTYTNTSGFLIFRRNYYATLPGDIKSSDVERVWSRVFNMSASSISIHFKNTYANNNQLNLIDSADVSELQALNGRIVYSMATQKYYRMRFAAGYVKHIDLKLPSSTAPSATEVVNNAARGVVKAFNKEFSIIGTPVATKLEYTEYPVTLQEVAIEGAIETNISNSRQHLIDAPFDMFAVPYTENNYNLVQQINLKLGQNVYDIQLLPYCPVRKLINLEGINLALGMKDVDFSEIIDSASKKAVSYILWASKSSDNFRINYKITTPINNVDLKVYSETTFIRLVSPNYNGVFEFNAAKNGGVDYFEVNYTYKPYSPYIHVNPNFKGLYGRDFNDARGLQCGGDFSVSMTSDAWRQYEISNKNYQNIFNTEIKAMDENQRLSMISKGISTTLGGIGTGLVAGLFTGNPLFGLGAGTLSTGAGIADLNIAQDMFENARQAKIDSFNLNLGNIKARPDSLTKVSAHTINNKYFPFIETYSSTETEKIVLKNKLKLRGMNLNFVGKINDIKDSVGFSFVKGTILRINLNEDSHFAQEINNRMQGGVYL